MKPEEFDKTLSQGQYAPVYYLYGDEPYLIERAVKRLLDRLVSPDFRDFNLDVFYGNECRGEDIVEAAQTLPMFADTRVVVVKKSSGLPAAALDILTEYAGNPSPSTCVIFQGEKIDQRKKFFGAVKKEGALVEFKRLFENQLGSFIRAEAAASGKKVDGAAVEFLGYLVGTNLQELASQLEKLVVFVGERPFISLEDVKTIVSDTKVDTVFELANALGGRDSSRALRSLHTILRDGEAPLMVLAMITRHFRQLWQVREMVSRKLSSSDISKSAGINPYFLKGVMEQARNFQAHEFPRIFEMVYTTDGALKSSGGKPVHLMECLIMNICMS